MFEYCESLLAQGEKNAFRKKKHFVKRQKSPSLYLLFPARKTILYIIMRDKGLPERIGGSLTKNGPHKEEKV